MLSRKEIMSRVHFVYFYMGNDINAAPHLVCLVNEFLAKRGSTSVDGIERLSQLVRPPTPPDPNPRTKKPFDAYGGAKQRPIPIQQHGPYDGKQKLALRENLTGPGFHHALDGVKAVSSYIGETIPRVASPPPLIHPALWRIPTSSEPFLPYSERAKLIWMARSQPEQFDAMTEVLGQVSARGAGTMDGM